MCSILGLLFWSCISLASECEDFGEFPEAWRDQDVASDQPWIDLAQEDAFADFIACDREDILAMAEALQKQGHRVIISERLLKAGLAPGEKVEAPPGVEVLANYRAPVHMEDSNAQASTADPVPVPAWKAWHRFYIDLQEQETGSPTIVESFLAEKAGLSALEASIVRNQGFRYIEQLAHLDAEMRHDLWRRFGQEFQVSDALAATLERETGYKVTDFLPHLTPDRRRLTDVLTEEGYYERAEMEREQVFRAHWESLAELIGLYRLLWLEKYIVEEVQPRIGTGTRARLVARKRYPLPTNLQEMK